MARLQPGQVFQRGKKFPNFDPRLPQHINRNPNFDSKPNLSDRRVKSIMQPSVCPLCGRKYTFDTGFRRVDCQCGCTFFSHNVNQPDTRMRSSIHDEMRARKEMAQRK